MLTILFVIAGIAVFAVLGSYLWRMLTERDLENARLQAEAEGYRGEANERRREASQLAAESTRLSAEASELDERARNEVEEARLHEERVVEAQHKLRRRGRFPRFARR
jgi:hypothetical protein